jgi:hypothetical protein
MTRIAWCEAGVVTPERDAGSRAVADMVSGFRTLGHDIQMFVEADGDLPRRVESFRPEVIVISRPGPFLRLSSALASLGVPLVYLAHDLHFVRIGLGFEYGAAPPDLGAAPPDPGAVAIMTMVERECFLRADLSLLPTEEEADRVRREFPGANCRAIDYFSMPEQPLPVSAPDGIRLAFVGGYSHAPNRDGASWFVSEVWPTIRAQWPDATVTICGNWPQQGGSFASIPGVTFTGAIPDDALDALLASSTTGIVPLRFGSGMKRKVLHYLSHGLPVVGSRFAVEGLTGDGPLGGVIIAETVGEWMDALHQLTDPGRWWQISTAGSAFVRDRFSAQRFRDGLSAALEALQ